MHDYQNMVDLARDLRHDHETDTITWHVVAGVWDEEMQQTDHEETLCGLRVASDGWHLRTVKEETMPTDHNLPTGLRICRECLSVWMSEGEY